MAVESTRQIVIGMSGDFTYNQNIPETPASNPTSPAILDSLVLSSGFNQIDKPTGAIGITIYPPTGNVVTLTLKGITGDSGIALHLTHPLSIGLAASVTSFGITTNGSVTLRAVWT